MLGGHLGFLVTYMQLKQIFSWRGMKSAVRDFVKSCLICQCTKPDRARLPGLLQPLHVPASAWQVISMDFVEGLARSNHANSMLVVVIKYDHFLPLSHPFTAMGVAWLPLAELRSGLLGCLFAELWYNSSPHSAIGRSPFEALYGYPPCHFGII